jgi:hypothetical protein
MKISAASREKLTIIITEIPYRSGPVLVNLLNDFFEEKDLYESGFPSRKKYVSQKIELLNGSEKLKELIEEVLHLSHFDNNLALLNKTANDLSLFLSKDGFSIVVIQTPRGIIGKVKTTEPSLVHIKRTPISHDFINEQTRKCRDKLSQLPPDIDGSITNARSLLESIMEFVLSELKIEIPKYDGNINILYKSVKKNLNLDPDKHLEQTFKEILGGLTSIVSGLSGLSNQLSDRHSRKYKPLPYHAELIVNSAFTLSQFLLDSLNRKLSELTSHSSIESED